MDYWRTICVLLLLMLSSPYLSTESCSINESSENVTCFCDDLEGPLGGWSYTCIHSHPFQTLYAVDYVPSSSIAFQCADQEPHYQSIFRQVELGQIQTFMFQACSLPNTSFSEIIPYREKYPVEKIIIKNKKDDKPFTASLFGNMSSSLKTLSLNKNNIESLPESLFSNFSQLKSLSLSDNRLRSLPESIFRDMTNLLTLEISNNLLESLPESVFHNLILLENLFLSKNKLRVLPDGIFRNLSNLVGLDLSYNNLTQLPDNIFNGLTNLIHIRLRGNKLKTLSEDLFQSSPNIKTIELSINNFTEPLAENLLFGLTQLEKFDVTDSNLTEIHENFFSYSPKLIIINLQGNNLTSLPRNIFRNNSMLKEINLNFNRLAELPPDLFPDQMNLYKLSIFKNNLSEIPGGIFQKARKIKTLVLGGNQIRNANQTIFRDLPLLEFLDLSVNNLTFFQLDATANANWKHIDLSYNSLTEMPYFQWLRYLKVEWLNLEHNKISYLTLPLLYLKKKDSAVLNFAHNNIKTVNASRVIDYDMALNYYKVPSKDLDNYAEIRIILDSNPFVCDCQLYDFYHYVKQSHKSLIRSIRLDSDSANNLTCNKPRNLAGKPVMSLTADHFTCEIQKDCSHPCHCYFRAKDELNIMNCSFHKMSALPSTAPYNTTVLFFEENVLTNMSSFNDEIWENLMELFLDNNQITDLDHWQIPNNLSNISLRGNRIKQLPLTLISFISNVPNFVITLQDNPFHCNCSTKSFKKWLAEHYKNVKDVQNVMCANSLKWNGTLIRAPILTTPDDILCPLDDWPYKLHLISVTVICVVLALLLFVVSVLYYRNKQTVIAYVYIHMHHVFTCFFSEEDMDEDKIFDAFVSYSSSDRDVALALTYELERKEPHFNLCIHERNWIAGNPISWNIFNSVHNSKRTILIISKEFLKSMWFQVEFHTAYYQMLEDKIDRLIIIVKGELPPKDTLDKDLQYLLSTKTYLIWEEKWFWEKLKYAMPHKKHQLVPNDVMALKDRPASEKIKTVDNQIAILSAKSGKDLELVQNHTSSTMNLVKKDSSNKK
ncbi:Protein toll [Araneus ventricosus]|uniref:Protein toll n=1 Tax=Araneus ventricosus TaxID=182803 RepID=A0A4Y2CJP0_ARAVE|nr:Protein toll [Araneus ventricosus]